MTKALKFRAMGCQMLAAIDLPPNHAQQLLAKVPVWFESWEASLSRFRPESELNQINNQAGSLTTISETMWSVLQVARHAEKESQGLVTPLLLDALIAAGYTTSFDRLEFEQGMTRSTPSIQPAVSLRDVRFFSEDCSIILPVGLRLDLGGVAKGWAVHRAMRRLAKHGPALVDAGGDIAISGFKSNGQPWLVGIDDPLHEGESLATLRLGHCGVATSGRDHRRWQQEGQWKHHIIDPRTGEPALTDILTATVIARNVMEAEMAAKVVLILGSQDGLAWLEAHPGYGGFVVTENGEVMTSNSFGSA